MKQTVRLGRAARIPIGMHWSVLVIMVLIAQGLAMAFLPATVPGPLPVAQPPAPGSSPGEHGALVMLYQRDLAG